MTEVYGKFHWRWSTIGGLFLVLSILAMIDRDWNFYGLTTICWLLADLGKELSQINKELGKSEGGRQ